jgi:hypothetical protein
MEGVLFQVATSLRACADWGGLLRELIEGGAPTGPLGKEHAAWVAERGPTSAGDGGKRGAA